MATNSGVSVEDKAYDYAEAFPALSKSEFSTTPVSGTYNNKFSVKTSTCTRVFTVPLQERRFKDEYESSFGDEGKQTEICKEIMSKTGVTIEMSLSKDQTLTVVVTGKEEQVNKARREVMTHLQTQASQTIRIPADHYRFILGAKGKKLHDLEFATATKISIPKQSDNSEYITIIGTKEGIDKAVHEIQVISDIQSKLAYERLPVEKVYHPFICGPYNSIIHQLMDETRAKINVPPLSVQSNEIVVSGEKEGVRKCKSTIMSIYEEKLVEGDQMGKRKLFLLHVNPSDIVLQKHKCQTVSVEVHKSQHKYVIGPKGNNLQEILASTGVSVEVPSLEDPSETITLRGEQDKLGPALTMVYSKANSVVFADVHAPDWLHKHIIGKKGSTVRNITGHYPKVHIEFTEGEDKILVEGPLEEVDQAVKALEDFIKDLQSRMTYDQIEIDQRFHKHIIGKGGSNITKIKNDTGVLIKIPLDMEHSNTIRIEGSPNGVRKAKAELQEMAHRMENEIIRSINIEQRFHRMLIGARGDGIKALRDQFHQVQITFPDQGKRSDTVMLRGPKNEIDRCFQQLQKMQADLIASSHQARVHIPKDLHKNIIGKGGATIKKIREETDTRIDLPNEAADSDIIIITGKKANVEAAKKKIESIQKDLANIKEITVNIPYKLHNSIIGTRGRLIHSIMNEYGNVMIRFPPEGSTSDIVMIRGPEDDAERAKKQLVDLASEIQTTSNVEEIRAKPEYHKFLIGRGGTKIRKVRAKTGARIIFPFNEDSDQELITIIGTKESVVEAKQEILALIKELENIVEDEVNVDLKYHKYFVAHRGDVLRHIADDYGGVIVSFPRSGVKSDRVVIKGAKECVDGAKKRILEIVADLEAQVVVECVIPQQFHRTLLGARGSYIQEITHKYNVSIKFPDRPTANKGSGNGNMDASEKMVNGDIPTAKNNDVIIITGKAENCEAAKKALLELVPITNEVTVPFDFHRFIIGQKGRDIRKLMEEYNVNIAIPPQHECSDIIKVTGPPANVQRATEALAQKVRDLDEEKDNRMLKSFKVTAEVNPVHHPKLIGHRGNVINKIRAEHDVNIRLPDREDENQALITITGYEQNCIAARDEILRLVKDYDELEYLEVTIDHQVHPRIIGQKGRGVRKIQEDFKVELRFPRGNDSPDIIIIVGAEENVYDCKDHLLNLEEEFLQDVMDSEYKQSLNHEPSSRFTDEEQKKSNKGFAIMNAPWDSASHVPDTSSTAEFPSFPSSTGNTAAPKSSHAWGPSRKF